MDSEALQKRIEDLEIRLAHQEYTQEEQARVQLELQQANTELRQQVQWLRARMRDLEEHGGGPEGAEPPPPHY
ncbi:SlyX family protein [Thioalkalivibrio sp. ALMg13-2]|uniref:SlyX family protein n=1 Tax=Thioalkalivibrio sp. ALMg13-2 TaxID=1158167 RepID=UPI00037E5A13|nr:SlyX family protein [Thioalkalivibrio sp. ALMg13-2]